MICVHIKKWSMNYYVSINRFIGRKSSLVLYSQMHTNQCSSRNSICNAVLVVHMQAYTYIVHVEYMPDLFVRRRPFIHCNIYM